VLERYGIRDDKIRSLFLNSHISRRFLCLPEDAALVENQGALLSKHRRVGVEIGGQAIRSCLGKLGADLTDVDCLCCITSTGWLTPGFSALLLRELGMRRDCVRFDLVGMGCNAGLNGLAAVSSWAETHPGALALMVCIEVCSAAYVIDGTMRSAVVNSLFGDGAAALAVSATDAASWSSPRVIAARSHIIPDAIEAMRYDWDDREGKLSFFLDPDIPYVVGANVTAPVGALLRATGASRGDVDHWIIHSGGKKVIDAVRLNLGLSAHDVRHTTTVLDEFGNVSSAAFLFSYERLVREASVREADLGVLITMGPGSTVETALVSWTGGTGGAR
jgi:polyketide synthase Type III